MFTEITCGPAAFIPRDMVGKGGLGKVFYGYGQSIRALMITGNIKSLVRLDAEPYLFWLFILSGLLIAGFLPVEWALLLLTLEMVVLSLWMRPGSVVRYLALPLSLFRGWRHYFPYFRPAIRRWSSDEDKAA